MNIPNLNKFSRSQRPVRSKLLLQSSLLILASAAVTLPATAEDATGKSAISAEISTTGIGLDYIFGVSPQLHLRASINGLQVNYDFEADDNNGVENDELKYEGDLKLFTLGGVADWYPFAGNFRVSGGLFYNRNEAKGNARCENAGGCEFGDEEDSNQRFAPEQLGRVFADVEFNPVTPYFGIGYGNPLIKAGWGFSADAGLLFQGSPQVDLRSEGDCTVTILGGISAADCTAMRDQRIEEEEQQIEDDVEDLQFYPVINLAVTYRFN